MDISNKLPGDVDAVCSQVITSVSVTLSPGYTLESSEEGFKKMISRPHPLEILIQLVQDPGINTFIKLSS